MLDQPRSQRELGLSEVVLRRMSRLFASVGGTAIKCEVLKLLYFQTIGVTELQVGFARKILTPLHDLLSSLKNEAFHGAVWERAE